ncbi:hypothetical protein ACFRFU_05085 [Streptomyces sp. NPDC056704]|uniref:hypothetical protein n=1 Tax=Streptomyces sp. NPDC056704 TaxID=3345917 RepID=UPI00369A239C
MTGTHMIVLPGGGYAEHASHEAEPVVDWLGDIGVRASVFRYPLRARHPEPLNALRAEIRRRRAAGAQRIGLIGFSAGGHLAGLAALGSVRRILSQTRGLARPSAALSSVADAPRRRPPPPCSWTHQPPLTRVYAVPPLSCDLTRRTDPSAGRPAR